MNSIRTALKPNKTCVRIVTAEISGTNTVWETESSGKTLDQALNTFTQATQGVLAVAGKTPIVWEGNVFSTESLAGMFV